ncbi:alpha/beta hydrolase [Tersicoccus phoenicis]|uniref:Alpha/beta hydrolase n=1 Tax=Tersicoccus phoenicis TaxID=554083 RepID=A0A1R1L957_9MICC|nr:alpha/beta hydrolase [Tersicoccus phoenicis]OMH24075.1 alpha/beta hydrolase [Tersicoccus phoenicis]
MTSAAPVFDFRAGAEPAPIRASTVLPARRENIELHTSDGLTLVGELALPADRDPVATLVTLHPLPTAGGFMDSHVFRKASYRLPALADLAVLRFNTRGTCSPRGCSDGEFGDGVTEAADVDAATAFAVTRGLPARWLVGWSFGTELALKHGAAPPVVDRIEGAVLLSPPLRRAGDADLQRWRTSGKPLRVLVPEHDDFLRPAAAAERFAAVPQCDLTGVDGAKHLWVGEKYVSRVLQEIVDVVCGPGTVSLPTTFDGPVATAAD